MKMLLFADGDVGIEIAFWLLQQHRSDIALVVTTAENSVFARATQLHVPVIVFQSDAQIVDYLAARSIAADIGLLVWWPNIIRDSLLGCTKHGFINTHPSLLPHNRGKHYNFWAIVEEAPFGVTLHWVDNGVDSGDIISQLPIASAWDDTGESLFNKARVSMISLIKETYPAIRALQLPRHPQPADSGSFHLAKELEPASVIQIDGNYTARSLLNLLRARTFAGHPACWFSDNSTEYEVRVDIRKRKR